MVVRGILKIGENYRVRFEIGASGKEKMRIHRVDEHKR
jgi:hypothetical protein